MLTAHVLSGPGSTFPLCFKYKIRRDGSSSQRDYNLLGRVKAVGHLKMVKMAQPFRIRRWNCFVGGGTESITERYV